MILDLYFYFSRNKIVIFNCFARFLINPELASRGLAILQVEENATFYIDLDLTYLYYMNSYGLFFSGITIVIFIAFAFQIKKKSF